MACSPRSLPAVVTALSLLALATGEAATVRVPADQPNIQAGIDAASAGDTVLVAPGTYTGAGNRDIDFGGVDLVLISEVGAEQTIIDCQASVTDNARGFIVESGETSAAVVTGFTIQNGYRSGDIYPDGFGAGIFIDNAGTNPTIENCILEGNQAEAGGGGLSCGNGSVPTIRGCTFLRNSSPNSGGGTNASSSGEFIDCVFVDNVSFGGGGGFSAFSAGMPTLTNCTFQKNSATTGGAILSVFSD
jgi:predicted outer membrane repeat protein